LLLGFGGGSLDLLAPAGQGFARGVELLLLACQPQAPFGQDEPFGLDRLACLLELGLGGLDLFLPGRQGRHLRPLRAGHLLHALDRGGHALPFELQGLAFGLEVLAIAGGFFGLPGEGFTVPPDFLVFPYDRLALLLELGPIAVELGGPAGEIGTLPFELLAQASQAFGLGLGFLGVLLARGPQPLDLVPRLLEPDLFGLDRGAPLGEFGLFARELLLAGLQILAQGLQPLLLGQGSFVLFGGFGMQTLGFFPLPLDALLLGLKRGPAFVQLDRPPGHRGSIALQGGALRLELAGRAGQGLALLPDRLLLLLDLLLLACQLLAECLEGGATLFKPGDLLLGLGLAELPVALFGL